MEAKSPSRIDPLSLPPLDIRQRYTVEEAAAYLRQSRAKTYGDIKSRRLASMKDGRRTYVSGAAIAARSNIGAELAAAAG